MPTYEYACRSCEEHIEVVQSFSDDPLTVCGSCGGELRKVFSAAGLIFKGSGWHIKDYSSSGGSGAKPSSSGASTGEAKSDSTSSSSSSSSSTSTTSTTSSSGD
jgi:putative FmdB family regulatory protein